MRVTRECGISKRSLVGVSGANCSHATRRSASLPFFCEAAGAIARTGGIDDFFFVLRWHRSGFRAIGAGNRDHRMGAGWTQTFSDVGIRKSRE